jgi:rhomboid protease GluP
MSAAVIEIYRSRRRAACEERGLVLTAVGIPSTMRRDSGAYILEVDVELLAQALKELHYYEAESRPAPVAPVPSTPYPYAWIGCIGYVAVLMGIAYAISVGLFRLDAFELGDLDAARVQSGEWWRAWTALTLHLDAAHLAANLCAGVWFGYLAAQALGVGSAWFLIVNGAALANWLEGELAPATHRAVGASTAVFTALGMLAAYSWRLNLHLPQKWALRWAPLVAGLVLLAWLGTAGEETDVVAHVMGFMVGLLMGAAAALAPARRTLERIPQWLGGVAALVSIALPWTFALVS